jgi:hypothetical protein
MPREYPHMYVQGFCVARRFDRMLIASNSDPATKFSQSLSRAID